MYCTALATFGKRSSNSHDWFEEKSTVMTPIIEAKRAALAEYKHAPSERTLQILRTARSKAQQTAQRCANDILDRTQREHPVCRHNGKHLEDTRTYPEQDISPQIFYRGSYHGRRTSVGEMGGTLLRPLLQRDAVECLPTMEELDTEPALEERAWPPARVPGSDGIPTDLIKHCKTALLYSLHVLLCQYWQEGAVPQDMRDAKIITLFENKGERSDCNNYRGISLFSVIGKVFANVILIRLQKLAESVYPEPQ